MKKGKKEPSEELHFMLDPNKTILEKFDFVQMENDIAKRSEENYIGIVRDIVNTTINQLRNQNNNKKELREKLLLFFMRFLELQFFSLLLLLVLKGFYKDFQLSDAIILTLITSVFIETLGAVIVMVQFAFDSKQEIQALKILHGVIARYKKFKDNKEK